MSPVRPPRNLLFVVIDQFRADLLWGPLSLAVALPNLRRLAGESVCFRNHHTVAVPCGPSRASLLTGLYAMTHRAVHNGSPLPDHLPNLATALRSAGRELLLFGYTDIQPDPTRLASDDPARRSYTQPIRGITEVQEMRDEAWAWLAHLRARGYDVPDAESADFDRLYRPVTGDLGGPALYAAEDSDTAFLTDRTLGQLDVRKARPWAALVTYIRPHPPFVAPAPWHAMADPSGLPAPAVAGFDHPFFDAFHAAPAGQGMFWGFDGDMRGLGARDTALCRAAYLGLAAEVDHHVGRLLDWIDDSGQADDTLVVLTADHGEMLGDLGLWGKQVPFRAASHVPLMIRAPGRPTATVTTPTRSIDLAPTLLRALEAPVPVTMSGVDLLSRETGPGLAMVELELGEPGGTGRFETTWQHPPEACRAVALETGTRRLVHFASGHAPLLFDTEADPGNTTDIAAAEPDMVQRMTAQLLNHRMQGAARLF